MDSDKETPQTADNDDTRQAAEVFSAASPFDQRLSSSQNLTFEYAKPAFASAGLEWSNDNLVRLHLFDAENQATNVALLLSDQCPYLVKCAVFDGDTKTNLTEKRNVSGSVLNQIDATMMFLNQHNPENAWPEAALRESLVNAVMHRDYDKNGPILISLFDSSIEIVSPGGLVDGFEVNDLLNGVSESRNTWLADVFEVLNLSENYGTGVQRILEAYSQSLSSPQLRVGPGSVAMILPKPVLDSEWPEPHLSNEDGNELGKETGNPDNADHGEGLGKAKRYTFPLGGPHLFTTNPTEALVGSQVLSVTPFSSVVFAGSKVWQLLNSNPDKKTLARLPKNIQSQLREWMVGSQTHQFEIDALEQITKHLLSKRKDAMSLREIQTELGTNSGELTDALEGLTDKGELQSITCGGMTKYSLPR